MGVEREPAGTGAEGVDDAVPSWLFSIHSPVRRLTLAVTMPALLVLPMLLLDDLDDYRPGALFLIPVIVVAVLAGGWPTAVAGALTGVAFWWLVVPPEHSFRIETAGEAVGVVSIAGAVIGLALLAWRLERALDDVRSIETRHHHLAERERRAREAAERAASVTAAVLRFATALGSADSVSAVADAALDAIELSRPTSSSAVAVVRGRSLELLATRGIDSTSIETLRHVDVTTSAWLPSVLAGQPALIDDRDSFARRFPRANVLDQFTSASWAVIPFRSSRTAGMLSLHFAEHHQVSDQALYFSLIAEILAAALERAEIFERHRTERVALQAAFAERDRIARTLSTALLPPRLPALDEFDLDAFLLASGVEFAGDFYDVLPLPDGGWVALIGDVCGKGAEAAAVTSLARYAARVAALEDPRPEHIVRIANDALLVDPSDLFCTLAVVRCTTGPARTLQVALAGHPQPRLLRGGEVHRLGRFGRPLGLFALDVDVHEHSFEPGDAVVLFTDGLIERNRSLDEAALDERLASLVDHRAASITRELRDLVSTITRHHDDDTAVLAISRRG